MLDPTRQEQIMKRTAVVFGIAAALFVAAPAAKAGNPTAQVKTQVVVAQVVAQRVDAAVVAQRVGLQRLRVYRTSLVRTPRF
jgi:hypothetical protein